MTATIRIVKSLSDPPGTRRPLEGETFLIGRDPGCSIVLEDGKVSRRHCRIVRMDGQYFLEDLSSRNKTYLDRQDLIPEVRYPLANGSAIRICDLFEAIFESGEDDGEDSSSVVRAEMSHRSGILLEMQPAEKLRALLELTTSLGRTLDADVLLERLAEGLFQLFRAADRVFVLLTDSAIPDRLFARLVRTRRPEERSAARFSRSLTARCWETAQAFLSDDVTQDSQLREQESVLKEKIRSVMCAPLVNAEGRPFGVIQVDTRDPRRKFADPDLELLCGVANQAAVALENVRLAREAAVQAAVQEGFRQSLERAREVLMTCLPERLPELPGYDFATCYRPAQMVGGDYYDFIPREANQLAGVLGDVAGKGMPAALLVTKLTSEVRYHLLREADVGRALASLNDAVASLCTRMSRFVTLVALVLDPGSHTFTLASAGHPSPLLYRATSHSLEECVPRDDAQDALGIEEGCSFTTRQFSLQPGDALILYSDGIPDAENPAGKRMGLRAFREALLSVGHGTPRDLVNATIAKIEKHTSGAAQNDDITLVVLGRTRGSRP
jgi:serine phosphatase RsbU (regulator of sigma subunit)/pSer/pThr/pTyr-binding forkhead associated (FHA) protein